MNRRHALRWLLAPGAAIAAYRGAPGFAQEADMHTVHQPYAIETFGMFRRMMLSGDFTSKVALAAVMAKHPAVGVGAVADARGEITIFDGKLIVSYGKSAPPIEPGAERAALLATGTASVWQNVRIERDVAPEGIEALLAATARSRGIDPDKSFPFEVRGTLAAFIMHVNAEPTGGPHGMGQPMAVTVGRKGESLEGAVAGLYVAPELVGIATHGGERTHSHWVSPGGDETAHLDRWGLKAGSVLSLPA
jgi:acetolactate decarboxylase